MPCMSKSVGASAFLLLATIATAESVPRIVLIEERLASDRRLTYQRREIGEIPGAMRIAVPEAGAHALVLTEGGRVLAWGDNTYGQLGTGNTKEVAGWAGVEGPDDVVAIAAGAQHSVALRRDGTVWTWGSNFQGQLGDGTLTPHYLPARVESLSEVVSVAAGAEFTAALKRDGTVWVWGSNWGAVAPQESLKTLVRPVSVRGLRLEGELEVREGKIEIRDRMNTPWRGRTRRERTVRIVEGGIEIAGGEKVERENVQGRLVDLGAGWSIGWIEIDREMTGAGNDSIQTRVKPIVGLISTQRVEPRLTATFNSAPPVTIAAGYLHSLRLMRDGTVWAWGDNSSGQLGAGTGGNQTTPRRRRESQPGGEERWHRLGVGIQLLWPVGRRDDN